MKRLILQNADAVRVTRNLPGGRSPYQRILYGKISKGLAECWKINTKSKPQGMSDWVQTAGPFRASDLKLMQTGEDGCVY